MLLNSSELLIVFEGIRDIERGGKGRSKAQCVCMKRFFIRKKKQ